MKKEIESFKKHKGYETVTRLNILTPFCKAEYVYKYMDIETAILCLSNKTIRFVEPTEWVDKYEGRFYDADYSNITNDQSLTPRLYANCFTLNKTSEAAWKTYAYGKTGLGCRCVQLRLDLKELRFQLDTYCKNNNYYGYESKINYNLNDEQLNSIHSMKSPYHKSFFENFSLSSYLSLLSLKRVAFYYENEIRFFLIPENHIVDKQIFVDIEWKKIIKEILVDSNCTDTEIGILKFFCKDAGIQIVPLNEKGVHIDKFNLYKMSNKRIKIDKI